MGKISVSSRRAGRAAQGAEQPEAWEKPFPTFASSDTIRFPPRVQTSLQRGFQCLRRKKARLLLSMQPLS